LEELLFENLEAIVTGFSTYDFVDLDRVAIRFHF